MDGTKQVLTYNSLYDGRISTTITLILNLSALLSQEHSSYSGTELSEANVHRLLLNCQQTQTIIRPIHFSVIYGFSNVFCVASFINTVYQFLFVRKKIDLNRPQPLHSSVCMVHHYLIVMVVNEVKYAFLQ